VTRHWLRESCKNLKILVAEDNRVNQKLASRLLEKMGHSVVIANNGREAVDILDQGVFDLVLMDLQMPGLGASRQPLRFGNARGAQAPGFPIYALTAHAMKGDEERCLEAGMDGYLSKPIRYEELYKVLENGLIGTQPSCALL